MANHDKNRTPTEPRRKEDYKAHTERDREDGWPYSDEPGPEGERLQENRPYAAEKEQPVTSEAEREGWHLEEAPLKSTEQSLPQSPVPDEDARSADELDAEDQQRREEEDEEEEETMEEPVDVSLRRDADR